MVDVGDHREAAGSKSAGARQKMSLGRNTMRIKVMYCHVISVINKSYVL